MWRAHWWLSGFVAILVGGAGAAAEILPDDRRSGFEFMAPETRAIQAEDASNPGMLWVLQGEQLWQRQEGKAGLACAGCHGEAATSMSGVAARYPTFDATSRRPMDLATRINLCRSTKQAAEPFSPEADEFLALTAYIAHQSRGMAIAPPDDARLAPFRENGRRLFERRIGQLSLSCASCHDDNWGQRLGGSVIPQGHPSGYPLYRLEWQTLGSLQRRLRSCMIGVRAEPLPFGSPELIDLELYLMSRAQGLPMETPAVRP